MPINHFTLQRTGQTFKIVRVIKDHHDNPYLIKCETRNGTPLWFMSGEFTDLLNSAKIRRINNRNKAQ